MVIFEWDWNRIVEKTSRLAIATIMAATASMICGTFNIRLK